MTYAELTDTEQRLEHTYRDWNGAPERQTRTWVDEYGWQVWRSTYLDLRANGRPHERAIREIENEIDRIHGREPRWGELDPLPPPPPPIAGQLRSDGRGFLDDSGPVLPLGCHFGEAFSAFVRRPDAVKAQLEVIKAAGYDFVRFWDVLGYYPAWLGREVTPSPFTSRDGRSIRATPDYYEQLRRFLRACADIGLRVQWSRGDMNAFSTAAWQAHFSRLADLAAETSTTIALFEGLNEAWQNGADHPTFLLGYTDIVRQRVPQALYGLSCPPGASEDPEPVREWSPSGMLPIIHGFRGGTYADRIRHIFSEGYEVFPLINRRLGWQGEPSGPGSGVTVGQTNNTEALVLMAAMSLMARQTWVYMSGRGVFWDGPIQDQLGFAEVPQMRAKFPKDLMRWPTLCHGGQTWQGARVFVDDSNGARRRDQAISSDGRVMAVCYGTKASDLVERDVRGVFIHPRTLQTTVVDARAGQRISAPGDVGAVFIGELI